MTEVLTEKHITMQCTTRELRTPAVAELYGRSIQDRARALIDIAHPDFREEIEAQARLTHYLQARDGSGSGVAYDIQHHEVAFTAQKVAASEHVPGRLLAKVVMVFAGDDLIMLVLPAHVRVDLEATRAALGGGDVRLAAESEFAPFFPDCEPGAMPPFGNLSGIPVFAERALADNEQIVFQVGTHTETMSVPYEDFVRLARPTPARLGFVPGRVAQAS